MKILNVAEKPSVAKQLSALLSENNFEARVGCTKYCRNYLFKTTIKGKTFDMIMTSVLGHLMEYDFSPEFNNRWDNVVPMALLKATIMTKIGKVIYHVF